MASDPRCILYISGIGAATRNCMRSRIGAAASELPAHARTQRTTHKLRSGWPAATYCGSCVVLPHPVSPSTTSTCDRCPANANTMGWDANPNRHLQRQSLSCLWRPLPGAGRPNGFTEASFVPRWLAECPCGSRAQAAPRARRGTCGGYWGTRWCTCSKAYLSPG
jgi:hypothetical protein